MVRRSLRRSSRSISGAPSTTVKKTPERAAASRSTRKRAGSPSGASLSRASKRGKEATQDLLSLSHRPKPTKSKSKSNGYRGRDSRIGGSQDARCSDSDADAGAHLAATSLENSEPSSSSSDDDDDEGDDEQSYPDYDGDEKKKKNNKKEYQSSVTEESESSEASSDALSESEFEDDDDDVKKRRKKHQSHNNSNKRSMARNKKPESAQVAPSPSSHVKGSKGSELWRQGVKAGLGPGTEMVIERPRPRDAGNVPYSDATIHPNTMLFLGDLRANNDREWLKMHDPEYRRALKDFQSFIECLSERITEIDDTIPELPTKDIIFRIYRDVRFSPDQTPYKTHFSAAWSRTGRKGPYAAYYMQIKPGGSYVGGGLWMPEAAALAAIRENINERPQDIKGVLMNSQVQEEFFPDTLGKEAETIKAFAAGSAENALKTKPKGYTVDHPNIELLRLRNFIVGKSLTDKEVAGPGGLDCIARVIGALVPFITHLNGIVMPDEG